MDMVVNLHVLQRQRIPNQLNNYNLFKEHYVLWLSDYCVIQ